MAKPHKRGTVEIPQARLDKFIAALAEAQTITHACKVAVIGRSTIYEIREKDGAFATAWDAALEAGTEKLEAEATRRAVEGTTKPVYQGGKRVGAIQEYSDTLLIFLLKAKRPDIYRERYVHEVTGKNGTPLIPVLNVSIGKGSAA